MNTIGYFEIQSSNPEREIAFYHAIFGWEFLRDNSMPIEYYRIETNTINGGLLKRPLNTPPINFGSNSFICSIQVGNFDEMAKKIIACGGTVSIPKFTIPFRCHQGYFVDQDNNTFGIFEVITN